MVGKNEIMFYLFGVPVSEADAQRLAAILKSAGQPAALSAADAISEGVRGHRATVALTPEMQVAVRSVLDSPPNSLSSSASDSIAQP